MSACLLLWADCAPVGFTPQAASSGSAVQASTLASPTALPAAAAAGTSSTYLPVIIKQNTPAPSPSPTGSMTAFSFGLGGVDVIPHQIVRANDDCLYVFGLKGDSSNQLNAYWTTVAGLPDNGKAFSGSRQITESANIISVEAVYDGGQIIHVLTNGQDGQIKDHPFDISTHNYRAAQVLANNGGTVNGYYVGTSGISAMMTQNGRLEVTYWTSGNHILYSAYTYNASTNTLSRVEGPTQVDASGRANHPALAISPSDGSVTVGWVSQASSPAKILTRTYSSGSWGAVQTASNAPVWTSTDSGINIDQGPSLLITPDGVKHLAYIEDYRTSTPYDYGRVHYVTNGGSGWTDQYTGFYSHDPALAVNSAGQIFVIGHGHPLNSTCTAMTEMCVYQNNGNGSWKQTILIAPKAGQSFDSSPSVKWSVVGLNRPETIEFLFSEVGGGYSDPIFYYGRIN